jgi:hypothetical protein
MPNLYVGDLLRTMAMGSLAVRTELVQLAVVQPPDAHPVQMHRRLSSHRYFRDAAPHGEVKELAAPL